jgi:hypothetical protein
MTDDRREVPSQSERTESPEERRDDWGPMTPNPTRRDAPSDRAAEEEVRQLKMGEENPT